MRKLRVAVDIGGTFTDLVAYDEDTPRADPRVKTPSTPPGFIDGVMNALDEGRDRARRDDRLQARLDHRHQRDHRAPRRQDRPRHHQGHARRARRRPRQPPRPLQLELGPVAAAGASAATSSRSTSASTTRATCSPSWTRTASATRRASSGSAAIESVAVAYLNSFMARRPRAAHQGDPVRRSSARTCASARRSEILPEIREFERTSTAAANAYLMPVIERYLDAARGRACASGATRATCSSPTPAAASCPRRRRARSRPASATPARRAASSAAPLVGKSAGVPSVITFDMGGTSADLSLVYEGRPSIASEWRVDWNIPILFPAVDLVAIGAGGGTIAWVDAGGSLRVGPQSAGADPGPACLGQGQRASRRSPTPTSTSGASNPTPTWAATSTSTPTLAEQAIAGLAEQLGLSPRPRRPAASSASPTPA